MRRQPSSRRGWAAPLVAVACLGLAVAASPRVEAQSGYAVQRFTVADRKKDQVHPRISGTWIVWKDYRHLSLRAVDDSPNAEIFARDVSDDANEDFDVAHSRDAGEPAISGTIVVWTESDGKATDIRGVDLQNGDIFTVAESPGRQEHPAIDGSLVVWQDSRNGNWDLFARELGQDSDRPLVELPNDQQRPAVSGRVVVWEDWRDGAVGPDVFGLDLDSQQRFRVTSNHDAFEPAISGRWVAWVGYADQAVFAKNLDDGKTRRLTRAPGPKSQPAISGDLVVWTDERGGNRDLYGYDLVTGTEFPIAVADEAQDEPAIDGARIVWSDARSSNRDILGGQLSLPRELTPSPAEAAPTAEPPAASVAPTPPAQDQVSRVRVAGTDGDGLNLRDAPSVTGSLLRTLPDGSLLWAVGAPRQNEGRLWRQVRDQQGLGGWVAAEYLTPA